MFRRAFRFLLSTALVLSPVAFMAGGCTRQAEGERCDYDWAGETQDCDDGLICIKCNDLQQHQVDRCCRSDGSVADSRCARSLVPDNNPCGTHQNDDGTGGTSSTGGSGGTGGTAGSGTGNTGGEDDMSNGGTGDSSSAGIGG